MVFAGECSTSKSDLFLGKGSFSEPLGGDEVDDAEDATDIGGEYCMVVVVAMGMGDIGAGVQE
jgi:hypothetical protein